jgi:Helix-turn-helix domain
MSMNTLEAQLFSVEEAGRLLGGISPWTLRKHVAAGNVKVTRIGRRVFITTEEFERIRRDGLPSLSQFRKSGFERRNEI